MCRAQLDALDDVEGNLRLARNARNTLAKDMRKAISANRVAHAATDNHSDEFRNSVRRQSSCCQKERAGRRCRGDRKKRDPAAATGGCLAEESVLAEASTPI